MNLDRQIVYRWLKLGLYWALPETFAFDLHVPVDIIGLA